LRAARAVDGKALGNPAHESWTFIMSTAEKILATRVNELDRLRALVRHFGPYLATCERNVYGVLDEISPEYAGGYWHYYELSNFGFYMAPDLASLQISVEGNYFDGSVSGDAAGIIACLFCFSRLSFRHDSAVFGEHFLRLRDFALTHAEASEIFAAID
jgi:hypothetical protein